MTRGTLQGWALVVCLLVVGASARADVVFQSFDTATVPTGWLIQGTRGYDHTDNGQTQAASSFLRNSYNQKQGYLELTDDLVDYQRTSAFYTAKTFNATLAWSIEAEIWVSHDMNQGDSADGLTFAWVSAGSIGSQTSKLLGGYGEWMGVPRGTDKNVPVDQARGYYRGLEGVAFEFDHFQNQGDTGTEHTCLQDLSTWTYDSDSYREYSSTDDFFVNEGWQTVKLTYDGAGNFTFYWDTMDAAHQYSWAQALTDADLKSCYFGVTAATGDSNASHRVRNIRIESQPEPASWLLMGLMMVALAGWHRRRRALQAQATAH